MEKITINAGSIDRSLIKKAADIIYAGGVVAIPTETVYGLGCRADKQEAVDKLYAIKRRPKDKPFSLALANVDEIISRNFDTLPPFGYRLMENFWPGPLTIIYYTPDNKKVGIRVPSGTIISEILAELKLALCLPSANISGGKDAVSASEVENTFNGEIDLIIDGGNCAHSKASTVLDLTLSPFKILRTGVITEEDIIKTFVKKRVLFVCTGNSCRSPMAQFLLEKYLLKAKPYCKDRYEIISAGISAPPGLKASSYIISILKDKEGLDAGRFSSRRLDRYLLLSSDLIFTMEDMQTDYILKFEPKVEGRVFNLKKFLPLSLEKDISDPLGGNIKDYDEMHSLMKKAIIELVDWL